MGQMIGPPRIVNAATIDTFAWEDGDEIFFQPDPASNYWVYWHMVYRTSIGDSNKWIFVGGLPLERKVAAQVTRNGIAWGNGTGTIGPSWSTVRTGLWQVQFGANANSSTDGNPALMSIKFGTNAPSESWRANNSNTRAVSVSQTQNSGEIPSGSTIIAQYRNGSEGAGVSSWDDRWIHILPLRMT